MAELITVIGIGLALLGVGGWALAARAHTKIAGRLISGFLTSMIPLSGAIISIALEEGSVADTDAYRAGAFVLCAAFLWVGALLLIAEIRWGNRFQ